MGGNATLPMTISVKLIAYAMPNARTEHILLKLIVSVTPAITVVKLVLMELAVKLAKPIDKFLQERLFALVLTIFMKIIMSKAVQYMKSKLHTGLNSHCAFLGH